MRRTAVLGCAAVLVAEVLFGQCGVERWPVKVATDSDASLVNATFLFSATLLNVRGYIAPRPLPQANRVVPIETTVYSVNATLTQFELAPDGDVRLAIIDEAGHTILASLPSPSCIAGSAFAQQITAARAAFDARFKATSVPQRVSLPIEISGIGFFNFLSGEAYAAPNGFELHPVLSVNFTPAIPATPPKPVWHRAVVGSAQRPGCIAPRLAINTSRTDVCAGESVTLTWQASDPAASVSIDGVGVGLLASGSTTVGATYAIAYSGRALNVCGAGAESAAVVNVHQGATATISSPASLQQGTSGTITATLGNSSSWSVRSAIGNALSPSSGSAGGTVAISYIASNSGTDTITLTANGSCGAVQRSAIVTVNSSVPVPQPPTPPPPSGSLRCCDGTLSPTCNNCASKQGCCSHHGGVCGCG